MRTNYIKQILILSAMLIASTIANAQWTQIGTDIDGEAADDWSGISVNLNTDGSIIAIGATDNSGSGSDAGHVRIYQNIAGTWTQIGNDIDGEAGGDQSGISVNLSADSSVVAIGAYHNDGNGSNAGHVRIYENIAGSWSQIGSDIDGEAADDESGRSVSLSADGSIVAIGAQNNDGNVADAGHVRIYKNIIGTWTQIGTDIDGEAASDKFGHAVSLSFDGNTVAIGAYCNDGNGSNAGHVRIYHYNGTAWTQQGADIDGEATNDLSGVSVSLCSNGNTIAIGAYGNDGNGINAGHVRIYHYNGTAWTQQGADINGEATNDGSGISVSLSSDGSVVAIGALYNSGNGSCSGHVRIYKNTLGTWTQLGTDIDGEAADDLSGVSVSLCSNGNTVAIGANKNDGNGIDAGHVRIYTCNSYATINPIVCDSYLSPSGKSWTISGIYLDSIPNAMACDSIITINLTINYSNTGDTTAIVCDSMAWYGTTYYASAMPTHTFMNIAGCDSVVTLDLTVNYSNTGDTTAIVCDSMAWYGTIYYASAFPIHMFMNVAGCDSLVTLDLTVNYSNTGDTTAVACDSMAWYGTSYYVSAMPTHTFMNVAGCDSVVTLDLTINYSNTGDTTVVACDSMAWYGTTYYASAFPTHIFMNVAGCDSVVTLDLTINYSNTGDTTAVACDSMAWYGTTYYASAFPTHTFINAAGCDSLVTLDLTINSVDVSVTQNGITLTATQSGASYQWLDCNNSYLAIVGETNQSFTPSVNGSYAVIIDDGICVDTSVCYTITGVGIKELNNTSINIFPNPTSGNIIVEGENIKSIRITDINGKLIEQLIVTDKQVNIDLSKEAKGIYFVNVSTEKEEVIKKIVIE